jgi:hypothetical protein
VDTNGLVLGARIHAASLHDRDGARTLTDELKEELPRPGSIWADWAYTSGFRRWVEEGRGWRVEVTYHRDRLLWRYGLEEAARLSCPAEEAAGGREDLRVARPSA